MVVKAAFKKWLSVLLAAIFAIPVFLNVFGVISMRVILTDSMIPVIQPGDIVVTANWIKPTLNDVAMYRQRDIDGTIKQDVVHRVITLNSQGEYQFKGDNNKSMDAISVPKSDVIGTVVLKLKGVGNLFTIGGMISVLAIVIGIWIVIRGIKKLRVK